MKGKSMTEQTAPEISTPRQVIVVLMLLSLTLLGLALSLDGLRLPGGTSEFATNGVLQIGLALVVLITVAGWLAATQFCTARTRALGLSAILLVMFAIAFWLPALPVHSRGWQAFAIAVVRLLGPLLLCVVALRLADRTEAPHPARTD